MLNIIFQRKKACLKANRKSKEKDILLARKQESLERRNKYIVVVKEKNFEQKYIFSTGSTCCWKC